MPGLERMRVSLLSCRPTRRLNSYAIATISGSRSSVKPRRPSMLSTGQIALKIAEMRMDKITTTNRKLVPQRGCSRVICRAFSTVSGSFAS